MWFWWFILIYNFQQYVVLVVYFDMRLYYSSDYDNCGQNDVETLSKEDQWSCGIPN